MRPTLATGWRWLGVALLAVAVASPALAQRTVTLRLNTATLPDTTRPSQFVPDPAAAGMQVRGCLTGCTDNQSPLPGGQTIAWDDRTTLRPAHDGGDYWSITFQIPDNQQLEFKFFSQQAEANPPGIGGWEDGGNHTIAAGTGPVTLDLHYFEKGPDQPYDWRPFGAGGDSVAVWFRVYMNTENAITHGYDAADPNLVVALRGNFGTLGAVGAGGPIQDWGGTAASLRRESTDDSKPGYHLFSGAVRFPASAIGQAVNYKFYFNDTNTTGDGGYEDGSNRTYTLTADDHTLHWVYYSNSRPASNPPVTAAVTFRVDVQPLSNAGVFQVADDQMQVRGGFNGWDCPSDNQDDCLLTRIPGTFNYARSIPITAVANSTQQYKYYVDFFPDPQNPDIGYEEPLDYGGGNRTFTFTGSTQQLEVQFFNSIRAGNVIPAGTNTNVRFRVNMARATSFPAEPFEPGTDSVYIALEDVIWRITQGFPEGDPRIAPGGVLRTLALTDPDGDMIYEGVLPITGPSYNGIGYRYVYGGFGAGETLQTECAGGFDPGRRRYRYVNPAGGPYPAEFTFALDAFRTFGSSGEPCVWEINPTGTFTPGQIANSIPVGMPDPITVAVEPVPGGRPETVLLSRATPNPLRGQTTIEYAVPTAGPVELVVFDVTGRRLTTIVDEVQTAGTYRATFDASGLPAGVYVYQLRAAGGMRSERMTVLR